MALAAPSSSLAALSPLKSRPQLSVLASPATRLTFPRPNLSEQASRGVGSLRISTRVSFFSSLIRKKAEDPEDVKQELLEAIAPLDRGAEASDEDKERIDQIAQRLEAINLIKEPFKTDLVDGKWELIYTTSKSILATGRPKFLRPNGKIYQSINVDTLRAQNMETWPYFNQVTANLVPLNERRVAVKFDTFKILGLIPIKAPGRGKGELEITYVDEELRVSRGDKGNLFILKMVDKSYRVPT